MNFGTVTGGVTSAAASAYTAKTAEAPSLRRVVFTIATSDSHGTRSFWKCEAEGTDAELDRIEREGTPGRGVRLDYELATHPFVKRGVHVGDIRFLRVLRVEFSDRHQGQNEKVPA